MILHTSFFNYGFSAGSLVDIGRKRTSNQDEVIICPATGFYAVSDGMGGLLRGGETSQIIQQALPEMINSALSQWLKIPPPKHAAEILAEQIRMLSDTIYNTGNNEYRSNYGATLSGVWLIGSHAIFVNLGDSRGYLLPKYKKKIRQITTDHSVAALMVQHGEITKEEARFHPASNSLTRFAGMNAPAMPDVFIREVQPGDRILLCSDGLHGMIDDIILPSIMRSSVNYASVCERLVQKANANGGHDNISAVYIKILGAKTGDTTSMCFF